MNDTLAIIMAGENSLEIGEITRSRSIGAVPVGARYRTIDFVLSNVVNSRIERVGVPTQNYYRSLMDHLGSGSAWDLNRKRYGLLVLPPYLGKSSDEMGDIDILNGIRDYLAASDHRYVLLTGSDLIFNTTFDELAQFHKEKHADITVMYNTVASGERFDHHVELKVDEDGRITDVGVNSARQKAQKVSMGVMYMEKAFLEYQIDRCIAHGKHDFVKDVLMHEKRRAKIYGFEYSGYVGRIHDINSYFKCNMDLLNPEISSKLFDAPQKIYTKVKDQVPTLYGERAQVKNSIVADGCIINGTVENSIIFRGVQIEKGAVVKNSIVMQNTCVGASARVEHTILDKSVTIRRDKTLIGQESFPVVVGKNVVI